MDYMFPIPHKSLGMPMCKGIEGWGTLAEIPHTFPTSGYQRNGNESRD